MAHQTVEDIQELDKNVRKDYGDDYEGGLNYQIGWLRSMVNNRDAKISRLEAEIERLKNAK